LPDQTPHNSNKEITQMKMLLEIANKRAEILCFYTAVIYVLIKIYKVEMYLC